MRLRVPMLLAAVIAASLCMPVIAAQAVPGGVYAAALPAGAERARFQGKPLMRMGSTVFVGVPIDQPLGTTRLTYQLGGGTQIHEFEVVDKAYTEQHITIADQAMVDPPAATLQRIRDEATRQRQLYNTFVPTIALSDGFIQPLQGVVSSQFGHRRFFNGQPRSPHSGLDIAADTGTPIVAAGNGTVTLAEDLYFNGNTLFVDHGQGLITMYCHMSKLLVAHGDQVAQGQKIGLVGATGRVTGPHLHWSVSLNGTRVDPLGFMDALNAHLGRAAE